MSISEQIGGNAYNASMRVINNIADTLTSLLKIQMSKSKYTDINGGMEGIASLLKHLKQGGNIQETAIDPADTALFEAALKSKHILYTVISDKQSGKDIFLTRDADEKAVKECFDLYMTEKGIGIGELGVEKFMQTNNGKDIVSFDGFDKAEIACIKEELSGKNVTYAVSTNFDNEKETYSIYCNKKDRDVMAQCVKNVEYDLSGADGEKYHNDLNNDIDKRVAFADKLVPQGKDDIKYVVDLDDPGKIITIQNNKCYMHRLDDTTDKIIKTAAFHKSDIMSTLDSSMRRPVIVDKAVMDKYFADQLVDGRFIFDKDKMGDYNNAIVETKTEVYPRTHVKNISDIGNIYVLKNIPEDKIVEISKAMKEKGMVSDIGMANRDIAYREKDRHFFEKILDSTLYKNMDPAKKIEMEMYYEGRGNLSINNTSKTQYIVDVGTTNFVKIDGGQITLAQNGKEASLKRSDPRFNDIVINAISAMRDPIILDQKEYDTPDRTIVVSQRYNTMQKSAAVDYLTQIDSHRKSELHEVDRVEDIKPYFSNKQKECIRKYETVEQHDIYVDRTFLEKIFDMDTSAKLHVKKKTVEHAEIER